MSPHGLRWPTTVLAVLAGLVVLVLSVPLAADRWPLAQVLSFRAVLGLGLTAVALALLVVPAARRRVLPLALVLLVGGAVQGATLIVRERPTGALAPVGSADVVVLTFNTAGRVPARTIAGLATDHHADVLALPETSATTARSVADLLSTTGRSMQVFTAPSRVPGIDGTALLVARRLGTYRQVAAPALAMGAVVATSDDGGPALAAVHPLAPTTRDSIPVWRAEGALAGGLCAQLSGAIVAGDLNATLDHPTLRATGACVDAARAAGSGAVGTWPAAVPRWLAAPIDHVLVDRTAWTVVGVQVLADAGSDHRPLVVELSGDPPTAVRRAG